MKAVILSFFGFIFVYSLIFNDKNEQPQNNENVKIQSMQVSEPTIHQSTDSLILFYDYTEPKL